MSQATQSPHPDVTAQRPELPMLLVLFAGSGCAALIYEIVWFQLLQLVIGSSAVSLAVLLGTFMGGMCLGSLALPRLLSPRRHPLRVYALLELGIGIVGVVVLLAMPMVDRVYLETVGPGSPAILLRGAVCAVCLLPATVLMGATLPAVSRWVEATPAGVSWLGWFYGANTVGAVFGCWLAGFYLLRVYDVATASYVAVGLNVAVAVLGLGLAIRTEHAPAVAVPPGKGEVRQPGSWSVYVAIALSGACALAAEVIWTRLLALLLGGTVYAFSIILAVFLVGLGVGSGVGAALARNSRRPRLLLAVCQLLAAAAGAWSAHTLAESLPYWPINPKLSHNVWITFQLDLVRCLWTVLPAAGLWGASFPLALAAGAAPGQDPGRLVGGTYAANTVGAIVGAVVTSLLLIPRLGTQDAQRLLIGTAALAALVLLVPSLWPLGGAAPSADRALGYRFRLLAVPVVVVLVGWLAWSVPPVPGGLIAYGRGLPTFDGQFSIVYLGEGINSSVAVTDTVDGLRSFSVSGKVEASTQYHDMRVQRMLGHLPALFHPNPRSVLVVGCGAGVTAGSFVTYPEVERITLCELEPLVPQAIAPCFASFNHDVVHDPRLEIVYDDARHYVLTTPRRFDIITSDPIHPWVKGSATLYTREYFELGKRHLNPGGIIAQWVPLYETDLDVVRSELATFFEVYPNGTVWSNYDNGYGYDLVLIGQEEPLRLDADQLQARLERPDHAAVLGSLKEVGFPTAVATLRTYCGRADDLRSWLQGAEINRDRNLRLQYLAGMVVDTDQSLAIYNALLDQRHSPAPVFVGDGWHARVLKAAIERDVRDHRKGVPLEGRATPR